MALDDLAYIDAALSGEGLESSYEMELGVKWVREVFVERLGWSREQLSRYAFRALVEAARPGEVREVRLKGPRDYTLDMDSTQLSLTLREASKLPQRGRKAFLQEVLMPDTLEVASTINVVRLRVSDEDLMWIKELAKSRGMAITHRDDRSGNHELSGAIVTLLKSAYGGL